MSPELFGGFVVLVAVLSAALGVVVLHAASVPIAPIASDAKVSLLRNATLRRGHVVLAPRPRLQPYRGQRAERRRAKPVSECPEARGGTVGSLGRDLRSAHPTPPSATSDPALRTSKAAVGRSGACHHFVTKALTEDTQTWLVRPSSVGDLLLVRRERNVNSVQFDRPDQRVRGALRDLERIRSWPQAYGRQATSSGRCPFEDCRVGVGDQLRRYPAHLHRFC